MTNEIKGLDRAFALLEAAALNGERCPMNTPFGPLDSTAVGALCKAGRVLVEISSKNFRRVTILTGPHAGKKTGPDPSGRKPWKVVGVRTFEHRREVDRTPRPGPSAPRRIA